MRLRPTKARGHMCPIEDKPRLAVVLSFQVASLVIIVGFRPPKLEASVWTLAYDPFRVEFKSCNCRRISVTYPATVVTQNRVTTNKTGWCGRLNP